jgi:hypothetical protein
MSAVTILTTLKQSIMTSASKTAADAESAVKKSLGGGVLLQCNLDSDDAIAIIASASASDAVKAAAINQLGIASQTHGTLLQIANAIDGNNAQRRRLTTGDAGTQAAFASLASTVQNAYNYNTNVDLANKDTLKEVIREAFLAVNPDDSTDADIDTSLDAIASSVAAVNKLTQDVTDTASAMPGTFDARQLVLDLNAQNYMQQAQLATETAGLMKGTVDVTTFAANTRPEVMLPAAKAKVAEVSNQRFPSVYKEKYVQRVLEWKFKTKEEETYTIAGFCIVGLALLAITLAVRMKLRRSASKKASSSLSSSTKMKVQAGSPGGSSFNDSFNDSVSRSGRAPPLKLADVEPRLSEYAHGEHMISPNSAAVLEQEFGSPSHWQTQPPPPQQMYSDGYDQGYGQQGYGQQAYGNSGSGYAGSSYGGGDEDTRGGYGGPEGPPISAAAAAVMDRMSSGGRLSMSRPGMDSRDGRDPQQAAMRYSPSSQPAEASRYISGAGLPGDVYAGPRGAAPIPLGQLNPSMQRYSSAQDPTQDGYDL